MSRNLQALSGRSHGTSPLSDLERAASPDGEITRSGAEKAAESGPLPAAALYATASFYDFLRPGHGAKRAHLCNGTACRTGAGREAAHTALRERYGAEAIGEAACVGRCFQGGGAIAEGHGYGAGDLDSLRAGEPGDTAIPYHPVGSACLFGEPVADIAMFYRTLPSEPAGIQAELDRSGLRGRGGAGFPFADKLRTCAGQPGETKYVVCNADEGDPGAFSDRYLLEAQPHRVLAGMLAAGRACGARDGYLYVRAEYPESLRSLEQAIAEYERTGGDEGFRFHLVRGAGSYVCGEETALLNSIEGRRPEVRVRPPFPAEAGLWGRPTLLSNVETFAAIPWILSHGGDAFAAIGSGRSRGTKLVCLDHHLNRPGVYEVDMGLPLSTLLYELAGGFRTEIKALQVGGPLGGVVAIDRVDDLTLDFESFAARGYLLGHAGIVSIPASFPILELMRHLFAYMADESCGKCVPCRQGTRKGQRMLDDLPVERAAFDDLLEILELGSLCALGGGLPLPIRNCLEQFADELKGTFA